MTEQGTDVGGWEYKRTSNDFIFRWLEQSNCICSICHGIYYVSMQKRYVGRDNH